MTRNSRPGAGVLAWCGALGLALAACSGGAQAGPAHRSRTTTPAPTASPSAQPSAGPAGAAAVRATWVEFFNGAVPIARRLSLLQDGPAFAGFVRSQADTSIGALVLQASATVSSVVLRPAGSAAVTYTILLGGKPLEKNLHGTAVYSAGTWQVATATFCGLLRLAYGKKSRTIPAVCGG